MYVRAPHDNLLVCQALLWRSSLDRGRKRMVSWHLTGKERWDAAREDVFANQLRGLLRREDVAFLISVHGGDEIPPEDRLRLANSIVAEFIEGKAELSPNWHTPLECEGITMCRSRCNRGLDNWAAIPNPLYFVPGVNYGREVMDIIRLIASTGGILRCLRMPDHHGRWPAHPQMDGRGGNFRECSKNRFGGGYVPGV